MSAKINPLEAMAKDNQDAVRDMSTDNLTNNETFNLASSLELRGDMPSDPLTIRVPRDILQYIQKFARKRGLSTSKVGGHIVAKVIGDQLDFKKENHK